MQSSPMYRILVAFIMLLLGVCPLAYAQEREAQEQEIVTTSFLGRSFVPYEELKKAWFPEEASLPDHPLGTHRGLGPKQSQTPAMSQKPAIRRAMLDNITFEPGSYRIALESRAQLNEAGRLFMEQAKARQFVIEIIGHADSDGPEDKNQLLSVRRAESVKGYLIQKFPSIGAQRLKTTGYGESKPICPANDTPECKKKNRRVEGDVK